MKKVIITGANGQLGKVFTQALIDKGYFVYAVDINTNNLKDTERLKPIHLDIVNEIEVQQFFHRYKI